MLAPVSLGLRIDVDTIRGTRDGVPRLLGILKRRGIRATWYVTLGPDNMGRHILRLLRPSFAMKMLRSSAPNLYGWDIILRGTIWPGPIISARLADTLRMPDREGHEMGVHAWDHHMWQMGIDSLSDADLDAQIARATDALATIIGRTPTTAACPGWRCTDRVLSLPSSKSFRYRSDCRGVAAPFLPRIAGVPINQPQVPVDLPTYDEGVGRGSGADDAWNQELLQRIDDGQPHVLTIHAESEGGSKSQLFERFLDQAIAKGHTFEPLCDWLDRQPAAAPATISKGRVAGRDGWLCVSDSLRR